MKTRLVGLTVALLLTGEAAQGQTASSRIVLATVVDSRARPLTTLAEDDFVVHESGEPREILSVRLADYPIVVLVDNRGSGSDSFEAIRQGALRFVARIGRDRAVAVGALAHPSTLLTTFEDDRATVAGALTDLEPEATGGNVLQGIAHAAEVIGLTEAPFSAIVMISAAELNAPAGDVGNVLTPVLGSRAAVHVVARTTPDGAGSPVGTLGDTLRVLSDQTRGHFTAIFSAVSFPAALDRLADRLAAEVMIEFLEPPGAVAGGDVKVGVRIPGARVMGLGVSP